METNQQQDLMLCERAIEMYSDIEAAIERGSTGYARERLADLSSLLRIQTQCSAFHSAYAYLPRARASFHDFKSELAYSKTYVEGYLDQLKQMP